MKKRHFLTTALPLLTAASLILAGCGAGSNGSKAAAGDMVAETAAAAMALPAAAAPMEGEVSKNEIAVEEYEMDTAESTTDNGLTSQNSIQPVATSRKLIRTIDMNVETTEFDSLLNVIQTTVSELDGYIEQSNVSGNSISSGRENRRYASLTVRIPSNQLDHFVAQVNEQGNVTNRSENVQDVTLKYSDVESRKKSLAIEQERLWALLEKADSVDSIIALESRLSEIRYQLESFESQLRTYDNQVDYSTVYLYIDEVKVFTPTAPDSVMTRIQKGFQRNLENIGNGFVNFVVWFLSSIPVLAVLAAIIAILALITRFIVIRTTRRAKKRAEEQVALRASVTPLTTGVPVSKKTAPPTVPPAPPQKSQKSQDDKTIGPDAAALEQSQQEQ